MGQAMEAMKKGYETKSQSLQQENSNLIREQGELKVTCTAHERRIKEKDKKIQVLESKVIELQEDEVSRINDHEKEVSGQKQMFEH